MTRRFLAQLKLEVGDFLAALRPVPVVCFVVAGISMWAFHYYGGNEFFDASISTPLIEHTHWSGSSIALARCCYWSFTALVVFLLIPHAALRITTRFTPDDRVPSVGFGLGDWRVGLSAVAIFYAVMVPLLIAVVNTPDFRARYPSCHEATSSWSHFLVYETCYALFFVYWEYFFRGFLTFGLEKTLGFWVVFAQMLPFVVMHFDKPNLEAFSSVFGGIALGYLALRTRSFWYGWAIHAATAITLDVLAMLLRPPPPAVHAFPTHLLKLH